MGVVQTEQVVATGEAYDVLLDMSFPKGMKKLNVCFRS